MRWPQLALAGSRRPRLASPLLAGAETILDIPIKALTPQGMRLIISDPRADIFAPVEPQER